MTRGWKRAARLAVIVAGAVGVVAFAANRWQTYRHRVAPTHVTARPFEKGGWDSGSATLRHGMARQLVTDRELVGRTRVELEELLGPTSADSLPGTGEWPLGERADPTGWMWNYDEFLLARFDERGVCQEVFIWSRD